MKMSWTLYGQKVYNSLSEVSEKVIFYSSKKKNINVYLIRLDLYNSSKLSEKFSKGLFHPGSHPLYLIFMCNY